MKNKIDGIVVVEGKTDTQKLKSIFDVQTIETNGSALDQNTINLIKQASVNHKIYLLLDPDGPGEKIRKKLTNELKSAINVFITKNDLKKNTKKIGIAEATNEAIINAFKYCIIFNRDNNSLKWSEYEILNLNSKLKRNFLCNKLKISECNHKTLFKRLNMMNIDYKKLQKIIEEYNE